MYRDHVASISAAMREDDDTFERGVQFASLSIQSMFVTIPAQFADVAKRGSASKYVWGGKAATFHHMAEHKGALRRRLNAVDNIPDALRALTTVPGLGLAKAGFVAQFLGFDVGCLDTRNIQREGLNVEEFNLHGIKEGRIYERKLANYLRLAGGRAEFLWDAWCKDVAGVYKVTQGSAEAVSKLHVDCIVKSKPVHIVSVPCVAHVSDDMPF